MMLINLKPKNDIHTIVLGLLFYLHVWSLKIVTVIAQNPQNKAVLAGTPVTYINCSNPTQPPAAFTWSFIPVGGTAATNSTQIVGGCQSNPMTPQYGTESTTVNNCNLIIRNASSSLAGTYRCIVFSAYVSSQLIVLGSNPCCSTSPKDQVAVNQSVQISCGTSVTGNMLPVMMTWSSSTQQLPPAPANNSSSSNYVESTITVKANIPTVPPYTCKTTFSPPSNPTVGSAGNAPAYTYQCNTESLQVLYAPVNVSIALVGDSKNVTCQDSLICTAVANPDPTFSWAVSGGSTSSGSTVTTSVTGPNITYTCTATNIQGSASASIMLSISECQPDTVPPAPQPNNSTDVGAIVGGVFGGLAALGIISFVTCYTVKACPLYQKYRAKYNNAKKKSTITVPTTEVQGIPRRDVTSLDPVLVYEEISMSNHYMKLNRPAGTNFYENGEANTYATLSRQMK